MHSDGACIPGEPRMELNGKKADGRSSRDTLLHDEDQLEDTLRRFNFLAALRERKQIRRVCDDSLRLYWQVELEMIMRLVRGGFAQWPAERPLNFRDVVQIIAVTDCLTMQVAGGDARSRDIDFVFDIISELIPANL